MNGPLHSVYGITGSRDSIVHPREQQSEPAVSPPKPHPRTTVSRPVTVGALREAKTATTTTQRVPITQRAKEPEVPARLKQKRKTIAFGATINVSQTVEREKDPAHPTEPATTTIRPRAMSLARTGVGAERAPSHATTRPSNGASSRPLASATRPTPQPPIGDENRNPDVEKDTIEELKEMIGHLETRVLQLEKRERESRERETDLKQQFERLTKHFGILVARVSELEGGTGKSEEDEDPQPRRLQYSSDEERGGEGRKGRGRQTTTTTRRGLFNDEDTRRALERQLTLNPVLRRQLDDALEQDKYDREYGEKRPNSRQRRANYFDEYDEPRAPAGRNPAPSAPHHRWKDDTVVRRERSRGPPSGGRTSGGNTRKRTETTPSRRRVTERVTMERVHHFDDDSDEEGGGGNGFNERYDSDDQPYTQYNEEIVEDYQSVAQPDGRRYPQPARRNQQLFGGQRALAPVITEISSDSEEDPLDRKRRELQARKEARERGGRNK